MPDNQLVELSKDFAACVIQLGGKVKENKLGGGLANQLLRSGTSIGANIHEANYASSRADFINKFQIALKECHETEYWLDVFYKTGILTENDYKESSAKCSKIRTLLIASLKTAKANSNRQ